MLDSKDRVAFQIYDFIEEALENAESVLIHSIRESPPPPVPEPTPTRMPTEARRRSRPHTSCYE